MNKLPTTLVTGALLIVILLTAACSPGTAKTPTIDAQSLLTQAAQTVAVELTKNAALTPSPTNTVAPTNTPVPPTPTIGQPPTVPAAATKPPATAAAGTAPDNASFVEDLTIPDGTGAAPGVAFVKSWRLKNTGTTTWTTAYALVFIDGERMGSPDSISIPKEVRPGETVDISVKLTAPTKAGSYKTFFRLRNAAGQYFKLDGSGDL